MCYIYRIQVQNGFDPIVYGGAPRRSSGRSMSRLHLAAKQQQLEGSTSSQQISIHSHTCWRLEVCSMMPNSLARSPKSSGPQSISQSVQPVGIARRAEAAAVTVARGSGVQQRRRHPGPESKIQWCAQKRRYWQFNLRNW